MTNKFIKIAYLNNFENFQEILDDGPKFYE